MGLRHLMKNTSYLRRVFVLSWMDFIRRVDSFTIRHNSITIDQDLLATGQLYMYMLYYNSDKGEIFT